MSNRLVSDWIDGFVQLTENSEPPQMYRLWCAISTIAAVLQRKCKFPWGSLTFYPNMYIVLVGPPAARKGTAMGVAKDFMREVGIKMAAEATTRESLIRELKNANESEMNLETSTMEMHSSMTIFSPELTVFLGYKNLTLLSDLTDWFDCRNQWTYRTKNMGTDEITGIFVNLIGATTPDLIRSTMPLDAIGGGLTSRMIFVFERNKGKIVPAPFYSEEELELKNRLHLDLEKILMMKGSFLPNKSFVSDYIDWYTHQADNPPFNNDKFDGYIERRALHLMKLCMILSAARSDEMVIDSQDLNRGIQILERTEVKMTQTFSGVGQATHAQLLTKVIHEIALAGETTMGELLRKYHDDADKWMMEKILETLEEMNYITRVIKGDDYIVRHIPPADGVKLS